MKLESYFKQKFNLKTRIHWPGESFQQLGEYKMVN